MNTITETYYLEPVDFDPFAQPEIEQRVPLAKPQEEIWLSCILGGDDANRAYNESVSLELNGQLDQNALKLALQDLILRHQSLRSIFKNEGPEILIFQNWPLNLVYQDFSNQNPVDQQEFINQFLQQEAQQTYQLDIGPLFRTTLFKLSPQQNYFTFSAHHIICDGWSIGILLQDLSKLYSAYQQGQQPDLPHVPQMSQYISEQLQYAETKAYQETKQFWLNQFKQVPVTELPIDFLRPALRTFKSRRDDFLLNPQLSLAIKKIGAKVGCSFVVTLLSAFEILLHKITGQQEVVLGLPAAGQAALGYYELTGHCVNLLPIKSILKEASTFNAYLKQRKKEILDALEHQQFSLGILLKTLQFQRDPSRLPLVPIVFNIDMNMDDGVAFEGLKHQLHYNPRAYENFEIFLNASGSEQELTLEWSYNTQLFKPETIRWMMDSFESLLQVISLEPDGSFQSISLPPKIVLSENLKKWNSTAAAYPQESLPLLISRNLEKHAVKTAIRFYDTSITNGGLLAKSNQLAGLLIKKGIKRGDFVAVALDRSIEMVVTILAVMKAGAAYIPLDPTYPHDRINFMLQDSGAKLLLTNQKYQGYFSSNAEEVLLEDILPELGSFSTENPDIKINCDDLAYLLYTSGSTGQPKGVLVGHNNIVNLLSSIQKWPGITADDRMLAISTISFDIAGLELFLPLISGAEMLMADTETAKDGYQLLKLIKSAEINLIQATPATFRMLIDAGWQNEKLPFRVFCCGEALQPDLAKKLTTLCYGLWNMYGPTETTIYSTGKQIFYEDEVITIGRPIDNTQVYILNEQLGLVTEGDIGEIFIGGEGVAKGYLNQPELTATRFPEDIYSEVPGRKMYRTGDLGRFLKNGEIEFLGRADHQVKIRGHRVELGEIESQLSRQENISQVVVIAREDQPGNQQLVAYVNAPLVTNNNKKEWVSIWKTALKEALPPFMVPAQIVLLSEFPLTPNKKIDRKALPKPENATTDINFGFVSPRTNIEKLVSDIWCDVLNLPAISIYDNFFEIGGHSLSAVQIMARLEKETGHRLPLASLFESPTIESLALLLQMDGKSITWDSLVPIRPKGSKTPLYIVHGGGLNVLLFNTLAIHMDPEQPIFGLQAKGLNGIDTPLDKLEDIATHYVSEIIKQNPDGPFALAGYSFGGIVAFEMAKQLQAIGKEVKVLALFDSYANQSAYAYPRHIRVLKKIRSYIYRFLYTFILLLKNPISTFKYKTRMINMKLKTFYWKLNYGKFKDQVGFFGYSVEIDNMNQKAADNYFLRPYNGKIDLFRAKVRTYYMEEPKYLGWKKYALKGVQVHDIPGDHNYIFAPPNDKEFASVLQNCLNQSA